MNAARVKDAQQFIGWTTTETGRACSPLRAVVNPWASAGKGLPALPPGCLPVSPVCLRIVLRFEGWR